MIYSDGGDHSVVFGSEGLKAIIRKRSWYEPKFRLVDVPDFVKQVADTGYYGFKNEIEIEIKEGDRILLGNEEFIYKTSTSDHLILVDNDEKGYISEEGLIEFRKDIIQNYIRPKDPNRLRDSGPISDDRIALIEIDDEKVKEDLKTRDGLELFLSSLVVYNCWKESELEWATFSDSIGPIVRDPGEVLSSEGLVHIIVRFPLTDDLIIKYDRGGQIEKTKILTEKPGCTENIFRLHHQVYWRIPNAKNEIIWE